MSGTHGQDDNPNQQGESSNQLPLPSLSNDQPQMGMSRNTIRSQVRPSNRLIVNVCTGRENQDEYKPGGFYGVNAGRIINSKYQVIKKIGGGAYSTVWMAKDSKTKEYLAFKIANSNASHTKCSMKEIEFLKAMAAADQTSMGANHVVRMKDLFAMEGENGIHLVMCLEMLGPSVYSIMTNSNQRMFHLDNVRKISRQLLEAVRFLHDECHIIHGDIKPMNIMLAVSQMDIERMDPLVLYPPSNTASYDVDITDPACEIHIKLGDFGCSRFEDQPTTRTVQTCHFRAPEVFFKAGFGKESDIWSVGCVVYELITGESLFSCNRSPNPFTHRLHHLTQMTEHFGPTMAYPFFTAENKDYVLNHFEPNGNLRNQRKFDVHLFYRRIYDKTQFMMNQDVYCIFHFLRSILKLNPKKRPSAKQLLTHQFSLPLGWFVLPNRGPENQPLSGAEIDKLLNDFVSSQKK